MSDSPHLSAEFVAAAKRGRFNPIRALTPELLSNQLDSFEAGWLSGFALTAAAIRRRDDQIRPTLDKREKAVSRLAKTWQVLEVEGLAPERKQEAARHVAALKFFYGNLTASHALDRNQQGGVRLLVRQMAEAIAYKYAVHEIVWRPSFDPATGAPRLTADFNYVPLNFFENTTARLRFIPSPYGGATGQELEEDGWLVTVGDGIMEPLSVAYIYKQLSLKDWVAYSEKFGTPGLLGKTNASKDSPEWKALAEALEDFAADWAAVINQGASIDLIEAKGAGTLPFPALVERMDRAIAIICRGADLSTNSAGAGSGQGASLQGEETDILQEDDADLIAETLEQISATVIRQLFGSDEPLAYFTLIAPRPASVDETTKKVAFLVDRGVPVSQSFARQELGVPPPAEGEALLTVAATPAAPALPGMPSLAGRFANVAAVDKAFRLSALQRLGKAVAQDLQPARQALEAALAEPDDAKRRAALEELRAKLPGQLAGNSDASRAMEEILATALASGAAEARAAIASSS